MRQVRPCVVDGGEDACTQGLADTMLRFAGYRGDSLGCRVQGSRFRDQGSGFRVQGSGFKVSEFKGSGFRVQALSMIFVNWYSLC